MTNSISINPATQGVPAQGTKPGFSALVRVEKSRYVKIEYPESTGWTPKIGIRWTLLSTKGNVFEKEWSTGLPWDGPLASISTDGKRLIPKSSDCKGYKQNSDAVYLIRSIIKAKFPETELGDDISVFEGRTFFIADDKNPQSQQSKIKPYPKTYYPEGWEKATAQQAANRAAKEAAGGNKFQSAPPASVGSATGGSPAVLTGSYAPPAVVVADDVMQAASGALMDILLANGGTISKNKIVAALGELKKPEWKLQLRQQVTLALWNQLPQVVATSPVFKIDGDTVALNQ